MICEESTLMSGIGEQIINHLNDEIKIRWEASKTGEI